jgi:hypothetical protein
MTDVLSETQILDELKQWMFSNPSKPRQLLPKANFEGPADRNYDLKNKKVRKFLQHEVQDVGINLGWTDDAEPATAKKVARWFFTRKGGGNQPLAYGEIVAIGVGKKPSFIRNKERAIGVDLDWSDTPVFEWILGGGKAGPINPNEYLAIYNQKAGEFFTFFDRTAGADIGWPSSKTWGKQLSEKVIEEVKKEAVKALIEAAASG